MKLSNLYNEIISEQKILFHGTDSKYEDFDLEKVGSADGRSLGGWGAYLTDEYEIARQYITDKGKIHKYQLKRANFFDFDDMLAGNENFIRQALINNDEVSDDDVQEFESDYIDYAYDVTNRQVYEWLSYVLGSAKNASLFLKQMGYDGNKFKDKTNPDVTNYVIYDLSVIKKINTDDDSEY